MQAIANIWRNARSSVRDFVADRRAIAATEFAVIVPLMLVMFFGTVEFSSAVAINRKVTMIARTLSDLTSQSTSVDNSDMQDTFTASISMIMPYDATLVNGTVVQIKIDSSSVAKIQWSKSATIANGATQATLTAPAPGSGSGYHGHLDDSADALDPVDLPHFQPGELRLHTFCQVRPEVGHHAERCLLHAAAPGHLRSLHRCSVAVLKYESRS
ncbi:hypothetical protein ACVWZW_005350 [Bradyrhizobium sp. F1.13.4]